MNHRHFPIAAIAVASIALTATTNDEVSEYFIVPEIEQAPTGAAAMVRSFIETDESWSFIAEFQMMAMR